jgi:DNA-binding CsgD family transcriptional regulator
MATDKEIIKLMDEGRTYKQVARELNISIGTLGDRMKQLHKHGEYPYRRNKNE